ncbi:hypothetical protein [Neolewinella agarilytica]|uniref:Uncharacterized protein n=1 Tax=Neolewinella agarilytica TaxID=478744 RepID=A0A1H9NFK9_9BACT|nr:hypothetical protein [Neolewinella agarilytica]SER34764.1 hypothetical protein SAMN05444359_13645 [Neolewinella agarilytica]
METNNQKEPENADSEKPTEPSPSASEELSSKAVAAYEWWDNLATFHPNDPLWLGGVKILVRVIGILVLLALSPLIILGFMFAFLAVA